MTPPDPTPALLPPARLAEIREDADDCREALTDGQIHNHTGDEAITDALHRLIAEHVPALLAHLDALQAPAVDDGGEALPDAEPKHTPTNDRFDGEVWRGRLLVDDESIYVAVALVDGRTVPMFYAYGTWRDPAPGFGYKVLSAWARASDAAGYARGLAAGRSEGEAERDALVEQREKVRGLLAARDDETTTLAATRVMNERDETRAEVDRLTAALRTETTMKEQVQDELAELRGRRAEEYAGAVAAARLDGAQKERRLCLLDCANEADSKAGQAIAERIRARAEGRQG